VGSGSSIDSLVIAMDGTAGSGKSSASRGVARELGLRYLDTGAMYRAMTWQMLLDGIDVYDMEAVAARAETVTIESGTDPTAPTIRLGGSDVSREIRTGEVNVAVSPVSAVPRVREIFREQQRAIIGAGGIVVEGRDIGTVVAPDADLKVYLIARPEARARRRAAEMVGDQGSDVVAVQEALLKRDAYDSNRATAPLSAADDAVVIDSTELSLAQVVQLVVDLARSRVAATVDRAGRVR
jgi:CMP/dCMP kinase